MDAEEGTEGNRTYSMDSLRPTNKKECAQMPPPELRRDFLRKAAALPLFTLAPGGAPASSQEPGNSTGRPESIPIPGRITRQREPENLEFPFSSLDSFLTPTERFYVRSHFERPELDAASWRLSVQGQVERPFDLSYDELRRMPSKTLTALMECSGNGRIFLEPPQLGIRWELGGVGNAEWTGVPLAAVLERAGVKAGAVEVILEGADMGEFKPPKEKTPGKIPYARSLTLAKALKPEVLLAYKMNGEDLPPLHGHPVRAVVPGWYGMASVKWLKKVIVTDRPFHGYSQTIDYAIWERRDGLPTLVPVTEIQVKSQIARPAPYEVVPEGSKYRMHGAAWAGEADVAKVEVSDDAGKTWADTRLLGDPVRHAWRLWEHDWTTPSHPGRQVLMARATDSQGRVQPMGRDHDRRDAVISHVLPIEIEVRRRSRDQ
jgi:DMSO/TMAO reductase YedYZ molybdopterin-dependent catalytic subunit